MLFATVAIMGPAFARAFASSPYDVHAFVFIPLCIVALLYYDYVRLGRIEPATWWASALGRRGRNFCDRDDLERRRDPLRTGDRRLAAVAATARPLPSGRSADDSRSGCSVCALALDSENHLLLPREPTYARFMEEVLSFLRGT